MASTARGDEQRATSRQQSGDQPSTSRQHHGRVVSHTAGRIRVRLHPAHRHDAVLGKVKRELQGQQGVAAVKTNARTGSVLVEYDHHRLSDDDLLAMLHDAGVVAKELTGAEDLPEDVLPSDEGDSADRGAAAAPHSTTATSLMDALTDLDRRLSEATGGKLDVKLLVPLGLGALAIRQIAVAGFGLETVPGYVLLWYTFDSFYKLHQRRTAHVIEAAAQHITRQHLSTGTPAGHAVDEVMVVDEKPVG